MSISAAGGADGSQSRNVPPHRSAPPTSSADGSAASPPPSASQPALGELAARSSRASKRNITIDGETWDVAVRAGQWTIATQTDPDTTAEIDEVSRYRIVNLGEGGNRRFYEIRSGDVYKEPILNPEPEKALPVPADVEYVHATTGESMRLAERIAGIILRDGGGRTIGRFSITNAESKNIQLALGNNGRLEVDGQVFHLQSILMPDANRIRNYDAFFGTEPPDDGKVKVWEKGYLPI
ncbi:hypothetical protein GWC77_04620 [Paraburkholderia sp. NMBU_R16]|uniref:hypothetical protein n=1 Tax=Paraburkholderia sp. NMBU_R16 TaxID=2698676 RepID=UPI001563846E|nr:hypothetical protein [Paraburkholderia sp. NMBU_R16]NRO95220.1 hypothetical protein [Paraburkholderia sp. NMBU_R16]